MQVFMKENNIFFINFYEKSLIPFWLQTAPRLFRRFKVILILFFACMSFSCVSTGFNGEMEKPSVVIYTDGIKSAAELYSFFMENNPSADRAKIRRLSELYVSEARFEGINSDAAFVQMCLETGFLRFGGLVTEEMNNFCGLGAIDENQRGNSFATEQLGVRAHIQHLKAYGTAAPLNGECVDPRYKYVNPKGKAPTVLELSGTWAADPDYGKKIAALLERL